MECRLGSAAFAIVVGAEELRPFSPPKAGLPSGFPHAPALLVIHPKVSKRRRTHILKALRARTATINIGDSSRAFADRR